MLKLLREKPMSFQSKLKEAAENLAAMAKARISDLDRKISGLT